MIRLQLDNISKTINNKIILDNVSFNVQENEIITIFGKSGAGKSMILNGICGFTSFDSGNILLNDININNYSLASRNCILLDQDILLFDHMSVYDNIAFGLKMQKINKQDIDKQVKLIAQELQIEQHLHKYANQISGGEAQRVALARALIVKPKVLLLDEPFSKLDNVLKNDLYELIKQLKTKYNLSIIIVSHDLNEALLLSDRILILDNHQIIDNDIPSNIYYKPTNIQTLRLLNNSNIVNSNIFSNDSSFEYAVIFYDDLSLSLDIKDYKGTIINKAYQGSKSYYQIEYQGVILKAYSNLDFNINDLVYFDIKKISYYQ